MTPSLERTTGLDHPSASDRSPKRRRHLTVHGSRLEALEYLPVLDVDERLELADGRISLIAGRSRVDVSIVAETDGGFRHQGVPLVLLAFAFEGRSEREADAFVSRYRHRSRIAAGCH